MTVKCYLDELKRRAVTIDDLKKIRAEIENDNIDSVKAIRYDKDRVMSSPDPDGVINQVIKLMKKTDDISKKIITETTQYAEARERIIFELVELSERDILAYRILKAKYVDFRSLEQIAADLSYSYDWVKHKHVDGLHLFGEMHPELETESEKKRPSKSYKEMTDDEYDYEYDDEYEEYDDEEDEE